jgi:hypothetical protein
MSVMAIFRQLTSLALSFTRQMEELKSFFKILFGFLAAATCVWVYLRILAFFHERGWKLYRLDASHEPSKVEIQTLFHGNTKDQDQL